VKGKKNKEKKECVVQERRKGTGRHQNLRPKENGTLEGKDKVVWGGGGDQSRGVLWKGDWADNETTQRSSQIKPHRKKGR